MLDFLPIRILNALHSVNLDRLYELRMRAEKPLRANYDGVFCYLGERGVTSSEKTALFPTQAEIEQTLFAVSDYSLYAVENQMRNGFVTGRCGERVGIAGTFVYDGKGVLSVHSITSLCIRVPHAVTGCAEEIYRRCMQDKLRSTLLLSPPGGGKTTLLRDISRILSEKTAKNVLVSDERGELSTEGLGNTCDVIRFADKLTAFTAGIRALRPDVIITDELLEEDYSAVKRAVESGIVVLASAHLTQWEDIPQKLFSRYVFLRDLGKIAKIYDEKGNYVD